MKSLSIASALLLAAGFAAVQTAARASIVERVVAVVGERPILLSELRHRARPFLARIEAQSPSTSPTQQVAIENQAFKEVLTRMIDDRLEEQSADKSHITVTPEEVDDAIKRVATNQKKTPEDLVAEARKEGLSEIDYREELRRQILEAKLLELRVRGRVRVTEQDAHAMYARYQKEMDNQVELRLIALRVLPGSTAEQAHSREVLAEDIVARVRRGEDFCDFVNKFSDDVQTKPTCGSRGAQPLESIVPQLRGSVRGMKEGETSDPIRYGEEAWVIVQRVHPEEAPQAIPPFEQVKEQMMQRAYSEAFEHQRDIWLSELKRGVYIDVRL